MAWTKTKKKIKFVLNKFIVGVHINDSLVFYSFKNLIFSRSVEFITMAYVDGWNKPTAEFNVI